MTVGGPDATGASRAPPDPLADLDRAIAALEGQRGVPGDADLVDFTVLSRTLSAEDDARMTQVAADTTASLTTFASAIGDEQLSRGLLDVPAHARLAGRATALWPASRDAPSRKSVTNRRSHRPASMRMVTE